MLPTFLQRAQNRLRRRLWSSPLEAIPRAFRAQARRDAALANEIADYEHMLGREHRSGCLPTRTLLRIESLLTDFTASAETGCGKSTIFFSRVFETHKVFCVDDSDFESPSSVAYFRDCSATRLANVEMVFGPTQKTLPAYDRHVPYDLVLIDGPHGYPFPELEYCFLYPHLKPGGLLAIDIHIPTVGRLADFIAEDRMFEKVEFIGSTAVFRRTEAPTFDPFGDGWWEQDYNRRRVDFDEKLVLRDGKRRAPIDFEGKF